MFGNRFDRNLERAKFRIIFSTSPKLVSNRKQQAANLQAKAQRGAQALQQCYTPAIFVFGSRFDRNLERAKFRIKISTLPKLISIRNQQAANLKAKVQRGA